jgi:hypothetical protein
MRDANKVIGKEIDYMGSQWIINDLYYVPNNPNIYVELYNGKIRMNVMLDKLVDLIINPCFSEQPQVY